APVAPRTRRQPRGLRQFLDGRAAVARKRGENLDVDLIQCRRALGGHKHFMPFATLAPRSGERVPSREAARRGRGKRREQLQGENPVPRTFCPPPAPPPTPRRTARTPLKPRAPPPPL